MSERREFSEHPEGAKIGFLQNEINLCNTFLNLVYIEVDDPQARAQASENARKAYQAARHWVVAIQDSQEREQLFTQLLELDKRLEGLKKDGC